MFACIKHLSFFFKKYKSLMEQMLVWKPGAWSTRRRTPTLAVEAAASGTAAMSA
jgi:hypothetical protein